MNPRIQITQASLQEAFRKLRATPKDIRRTNERLMRQIAGQAGVELANATNPPFFSQSSYTIQGFTKNISIDIDRAFPNASKLYRRVKNLRSKEMADAFWVILNEQGKESANVFLASIGINNKITNFSDDYVKRNRKAKGKVSLNVFPLFLPDDQESAKETETKQKQGNIGLAKAGWLSAVNSITRSRAGGASLNWVRELTSKATGSGHMTSSEAGIKITLVNTVPHASDAINKKLMAEVPQKLTRRFMASIRRQLQYALKKL